MDKKVFHIFLGIMLLLLAACASIGQPDGGPYDETPPKLLSSKPAIGAVNSTLKKIELTFDEYIKIENASEKVIVSPPQIEQAEIKTVGKKVVVELNDSLKPNTTYSIDFSDAIVDNNEGNPMGNFAFTFSTGAVVDSMEVSGTVLNAEDLEPIKGILVGLHSDLSDTAFVKKPVERVARTNGSGRFVIKGVAPGTYHIFALQDADQDFKFSQKSERIAFLSEPITSTSKPDIRLDTMWTDSIHYDTIIPVRYTHFYPDQLLLKAFNEKLDTRFLTKSERLEPHKFSLYFTTPADTLPLVEGLNFDAQNDYVLEASAGKDTLHFWMKDSLVYKQDTLAMKLTYFATDTTSQLVLMTDTLKLVPKKNWSRVLKEKQQKLEEWEKERKKKSKKGEHTDSIPPVTPLEVRITPSTLDLDSYVTIGFKEPLTQFDTAGIHLQLKVDTLWNEVDYQLELAPGKLYEYQLISEWRYGQEYQLLVDSACFHGLYGTVNNPIKNSLKVKTEDEYSTLFLNLHELDSPAYIELLSNDKVVKQVKVANNRAEFFFVNPGSYYLRLVKDTNEDGKWTTGDYTKGIQPEEVLYYPQALELKKQWELTQDWNLSTSPKTKPEAITKQKPDAEKSVKNRNAERLRKKQNGE